MMRRPIPTYVLGGGMLAELYWRTRFPLDLFSLREMPDGDIA